MARVVMQTTAADVEPLLDRLRTDGFDLEVYGGRLRVRPVSRITPALRAELDRAKPALMALLAPPRGFVTLKGGPTLPVEVIELAIALEERHIALRTDDNHEFIVPNDPRLTATDRAAILRWRHHLGAIVEYVAPEIA
jgi:hypothetical protein